MNQLELILKTIQSAKSANQAAIQALTAVEQMLLPPQPEPEVEEPVGCQHKNAIPVSTLTGEYRLCECGEQITI